MLQNRNFETNKKYNDINSFLWFIYRLNLTYLGMEGS